MKIIQTKFLTFEQKQSLFELWNAEYPERIGYKNLSEFENYLEGLLEIKHYLLVDDLNQIFGWAFTFIREDEDWFGIIINSKIQGKKFGTLLLDELKRNTSVLNGWATDHQNDVKRNKEAYLSPLEFYTKNGFIVDQTIRMENEKISAIKIRWEKGIAG
ncbi:GNAT family N-acetyltransferase [Flavobacterium taihuense]|uniref:GNAT family N-acetyltransferase n=1 Tax=Flavobacterium taihuense TaxID=2857508 RepID=A0ABS6XQC5_9FLAO|nr:GNAT family N-acetyltransferase [Flavobacterium taihuense]MBW4358888.1 GNAT family N-acetyltransferase [Flavobacterium taihuense]